MAEHWITVKEAASLLNVSERAIRLNTERNWKAADLCEDDRLDVFDLCMMKRMLVENS